jgi:hypothetical protein
VGVRAFVIAPAAAVALVALLLAAGCGGGGGGQSEAAGGNGSSASCPPAARASWQKLADRVGVAVYCPAWLPDPLVGRIGDTSNSVDSVASDRSWLQSFLYQQEGQEIHVNLRGYPGHTAVPSCRSVQIVGGRKVVKQVPCFDDPRGTRDVAGTKVTIYGVNQDADQWHVLYAWERDGTLYTVSEHIAPPFTSATRVMRNLDQIMRSLELIEPSPAG